jgi:hypothetical protein
VGELGQWIVNSGKRTHWRLSLRLLLIPLLPLHTFALFMGKRCSHFSLSLSLSRTHIFVVFNVVGDLFCFVLFLFFFFVFCFVFVFFFSVKILRYLNFVIYVLCERF